MLLHHYTEGFHKVIQFKVLKFFQIFQLSLDYPLHTPHYSYSDDDEFSLLQNIGVTE